MLRKEVALPTAPPLLHPAAPEAGKRGTLCHSLHPMHWEERKCTKTTWSERECREKANSTPSWQAGAALEFWVDAPVPTGGSSSPSAQSHHPASLPHTTSENKPRGLQWPEPRTAAPANTKGRRRPGALLCF